MIKIYGIKNCSTMKKTFAWLDQHNIAYEFHDYKKHGADQDVLEKAFAMHGWEKVINRAGMTWRNIPDHEKENMGEREAFNFANDKPSAIKRPMIVSGNDIILGFKEDVLKDKLTS